MPAHKETRVVPHTPEQMFALVAGVERYPDFLPWCVAARIQSRQSLGTMDIMIADLIVSYKVFREQFSSRVELREADLAIDVSYLKGPFTHLTNEWRFSEHDEGCEVCFFIDFDFRSKTLKRLIAGVFSKAVERMVNAFMARAEDIYGATAPAEGGPTATMTPPAAPQDQEGERAAASDPPGVPHPSSN